MLLVRGSDCRSYGVGRLAPNLLMTRVHKKQTWRMSRWIRVAGTGKSLLF